MPTISVTTKAQIKIVLKEDMRIRGRKAIQAIRAEWPFMRIVQKFYQVKLLPAS